MAIENAVRQEGGQTMAAFFSPPIARFAARARLQPGPQARAAREAKL
jgi:hypothetical protein